MDRATRPTGLASSSCRRSPDGGTRRMRRKQEAHHDWHVGRCRGRSPASPFICACVSIIQHHMFGPRPRKATDANPDFACLCNGPGFWGRGRPARECGSRVTPTADGAAVAKLAVGKTSTASRQPSAEDA